MGFWQSVNQHLQNVSTQSLEGTKPESLQEILNQTAESHLAHQSKIESLVDLVQADDYEKLAHDDREKVRQYEAAKMGWRQPTEGKPTSKKGLLDKMGHILGDVTIHSGGENNKPLTGLIVPLAAIGTMGFLGYTWMQQNKPATPEEDKSEFVDTDTISEVQLGFGPAIDYEGER